MTIARWISSWLLVGVILVTTSVYGDIIDFAEWTQIQDPADANFVGSVDSASQITLSAIGGPVPAATDIGYQSVNGNTAADSTSGYAFDPSADFSVAVDFSLSVSGIGGLGVGFGIGEDQNGSNSAGVAMLTANGMPLLSFVGAARIDDVNETPQLILAAQNSGRLVVSYIAASGDVQVGVSTNGDDTPEGTVTFFGIQNSWNNEPLLPSFFLRSDNTLGSAWTSGTADAVFSGFHVIDGIPIAIPESSTLLLATLGLLGLLGWGWRRRRQSPI